MEIVGYIACFGIGLVLGLIGGGGSLLAIPTLVYLFNVEIVEATAYSLVIVGFSSLAGSVQRFRSSLVDFKIGLIFGIPSIVTIFIIRKWVIPSLPDALIQIDSLLISKRLFILTLFSVLFIGSSYVMITKNIKPIIDFGENKKMYLMIQGALVGILTGMVGIGGGFLILPALIFLAKLPFNTAVGTTLFIIAIKSLTGFMADATNYAFNWPLLSMIMALAFVGIITGNHCSKYCAQDMLKKTFGWFTLVIGLTILMKETYVLFWN